MKDNICTSILLCLLLIGSGSPLHAQRQITVEQAVQRAMEHNLQIKQAEFQAALSDYDLQQSHFNFLPTINAGANGSRNWGLSFDQIAGRLVTQSANSAGANLSSSLDLFQGFNKINQVRANRYQLLANEENIERVRNDLTLAVVTNYLEALTNYDLWLASQEQHALSLEQQRVMEINVEAGNNTIADLAQTESQAATDELNITTAQNAYEFSLLNLKQLMEMDPSEDIELRRPSIEQVRLTTNKMLAREIYGQAVQRYPEIKVAEYHTLVAERSIALAKSGLYPSLSISGGIGTSYSSQAVDFVTQQFVPFGDQLRRNRAQSVGINLSIPIFNQWRTRIGVSKAKINYQHAQTQEQLTRNNFQKIIHQAVQDLRSAEKRLVATETALSASRRTFEAINLRFDEGMANAVELNTAQTNMNRAEFDNIQAQYDLVFRSKVIDFYLGNPVRF